MTEILDNALTRFWDFVDSRGVIRRVVLFIAIYLTWLAGEHAYVYAMQALASGKVDVAVAGVIAAFTAPASWLSVAIFKSYVESRA